MCFVTIIMACYKKIPYVSHSVFDGLQMAFVRWVDLPGFTWIYLDFYLDLPGSTWIYLGPKTPHKCWVRGSCRIQVSIRPIARPERNPAVRHFDFVSILDGLQRLPPKIWIFNGKMVSLTPPSYPSTNAVCKTSKTQCLTIENSLWQILVVVMKHT